MGVILICCTFGLIRLLYYLPMERMSEEELKKELEKLKDFKVYVFEWEVYVKAEDYKKIAIENKKLKEKVRFLEECLDRKEKVNKSLREELSAYDREYFDEDKKAKNIFIDKSWKVIKGWEFTTLC